MNAVDVNAYVTVSDVDFKNGVLTFPSLYLSIDANESFIVYVFTTALPSPTLGDSRTTYDNKTGIYSLSQQEFTNGLQLKFNLEGLSFVTDRLECGIAIGLNVTANTGAKNVYPDLNFPLRDDWNITATITEATGQEASQYALYGMYAINQSIAASNLTQFYVIKIDVTRTFNLKNVVYWIPPIFMLLLLFVSLLLIYEKDLANSLLVYVSVNIFAFGYLLTLRDITPPLLTSIEILTLVDVSLSFVLSIGAILWHFAKRKVFDSRKQMENLKEELGQEDENKAANEKTENEGQDKKQIEKQTTKTILDIIRLIDRNKKILFQRFDLFRGQMRFPTITFAGLFALVWGYEFILTILLTLQGRTDITTAASEITILLSLMGAIIAGLSLLSHYFEENIVKVNYDRLKKCVIDKNKPFLMALVKMKAKNPEFTLKQIYDMNKSLFTTEKLLETVYK